MVIMPSGSRRATSTPALALRVSRSPPRQPQHAGDRAVGNPAGSVDVADPGHHNPRAGGKASGRERATRGPSPLPTVSGAGGGGNNRAMGRTVTATFWPGGSGTATRAPGGHSERSAGRRVRAVPGFSGNRTGSCVREGSEHPVADPPPKTGSRRAGWPVDPTSRSGHTSVNLYRVESCTSTVARSPVTDLAPGAMTA